MSFKFGFLVLLAFLCHVGAKVTYKGYKMVRVEPATKAHQTLLQQFRNLPREEVIILDDYIVPGKPVSLVVSPTFYQALEHRLKRYSIPFTVVYEDMAPVIEKASFSRTTDESPLLNFDFGVYHNLQEIEAFLFGTAENNSDIVQILQIGYSYEGRPFYALHISTDFAAGREAFWLDGGIHSREWIAPATMLYYIDQIISLYRSGEDEIITNVLESFDIYIMAVFNVDGFEYTFSDDRLWRKTRTPNVGSPNCVGTDPNRNWDTHWAEVGASPDPCSDTYPGPGAFSEPEVRAVADYVSKNNVVLYMAFHNCGQFYMTPYGYTFDEAPDYDELMDILGEAMEALQEVNGAEYTYDSLANLVGENAGSSADFTYEELGIKYSYGVELRDLGQTCFELPEDQILPTATENFAALRVIMNRVLEALAPAKN